MKKSTKVTITILLFLLLQALVTGFAFKLSAEPIKTSETTFILTEDDPTVEYKVATMKDYVNAIARAVKANEDILIGKRLPGEVLEGMKLMNSEAATFTYENVEVYFYDGKTYFIIHK